MQEWLSALLAQTGPAVLVTVARAEGSVPREPGAKMLVTQHAQVDTIGGGHLELCASRFAHEMLANTASNQPRLERFPLGPTLGQCCGGVVWLAFERIEPAAHASFRALQQHWQQGQDSWRLLALDSDLPSAIVADALPAPLDFDRTQACHLMQDRAGKSWLIDPCLPHRAQLFLFGAGHVGAAIVRALAELPCRVTWVDERAEQFPLSLPANVTLEVTDTPEAVIDAAPANASFLVMTHSHALDQRLAEQILRRADSGWFGLIGSRTKRIQFERRLRERGIAEARLAGMVCPIGLPGIAGKAPAVIAAAVVAQLLQVWEQQQSHAIARDTNLFQENRR